MNKIKQLEVRKLIKELNFVESDYTYKNEMVNEIEGLFINSVNEFLEKHPDIKEAFDRKINQKIENIFRERIEEIEEKTQEDDLEFEIEDELQEHEIKVDARVTKLKKLYREIVKITHPDRTNSKKLNEIYIRATKFYDSLDIPGTYSICDELDIEYEIDEKDLNLISEKISRLKEGIVFMESTLTWKWYNSDDSEKNQIMLRYIKSRLEN